MISGLVLANCYLGQDTLAEKAIMRINGVLQVYRTLGVYDLIVRVQALDEQKLKEVVRGIRSAQGIQSVLTNIIYENETELGAASA